MTDISIIIPVYNVENYICECLHSVTNQTFNGSIECIIVDDRGSDNSIELTQKFIDAYKEKEESLKKICFRLIHHSENKGLSEARNTGIRLAEGEYVYFLDSDDTITPNCMEFMWGLIEKYGNVDLVQGSFYETESEKQSMSSFSFPHYSNNRKQIKSFLLQYEGEIIGAQSRLIRRDFILGNNLFFKKGIVHEDNLWTYFLAKYVSTMAFCPERTYFHRKNPYSITGCINKEREIFSYRTIVEECSKDIDSFLQGRQKELILNNIITALRNNYFDSKESLLNPFLNSISLLEKILLRLYFVTKSRIVLHFLIRLFKFRD